MMVFASLLAPEDGGAQRRMAERTLTSSGKACLRDPSLVRPPGTFSLREKANACDD